MKKIILAAIAFATVWGCKNVEDASPSTRNTFIRAYEGPLSYSAASIDTTADGFIVMATMQVEAEDVRTIVFRTDKAGNRLGDATELRSVTGKAIKTFTNTSFSGYLIVGDSIKINPNAPSGGNIEVSSMQIIYLNNDLNKVGSYSLKDSSPDPNRVLTDYSANALTITSTGRVMVLGSYVSEGEPKKPFILSLSSNLTHEWTNYYNVIELDNINGRSVHYSNGNIIWASSILSQSGNFSDSYITIPFVKETLSFKNYAALGQDAEHAFFVNDIQPARASGFGYGVVGTYGNRDGAGKNLFFARVNADGDILQDNALYIDAATGITARDVSAIEDTGDALAHTSDGGFILGGTITTIAGEGGLGKGARDILLVKISAFGALQWIKTIGGAGDETVSAVLEAEDGGLVVFGTNNIGNYSSIFLIKTNSKGELAN